MAAILEMAAILDFLHGPSALLNYPKRMHTHISLSKLTYCYQRCTSQTLFQGSYGSHLGKMAAILDFCIAHRPNLPRYLNRMHTHELFFKFTCYYQRYKALILILRTNVSHLGKWPPFWKICVAHRPDLLRYPQRMHTQNLVLVSPFAQFWPKWSIISSTNQPKG